MATASALALAAPTGLALALAAPTTAVAQTAVTPPPPAPSLGAAAADIARGEYAAALERLARSDGAAAGDARARLLAILGRSDDALREARAAGARVAAGEILAATGNLAAAERAFADGLGGADSLAALVGLAAVAARTDRADDAAALLDRALAGYRGAAGDARALLAVAEAARRAGRTDSDLFHDAVRVLEEAGRALPEDPEPEIRLAALFLDKYDSGEADRALRGLLKRAPMHPGALLLMARVRRFDGSSEAEELTRRALEVNPSSAEARAFLAVLRLEVADFDGARGEAARALESDPSNAEAVGVLVAADLLEDEADGPSRRLAALPGRRDRVAALVTASRLASRHHRYARAAELAGEAARLDPEAWDAHGESGLNLLRTGSVEEARLALERAFAGDPFNIWFKNTLDLLDTFDRYETRATEHFRIVLRRDESALLGPYMEEIAEDAYRRLSERYGHRPATPVRLEVYPEHGDFSVRTVGLPGFSALGVAFGNVLAMDSPSARERGTFNWASTLWHEVAHAVTLGATGNRVPRWLTEGISVREERRARPGWGRRITPAFVAAYEDGRMPPVSRLNEGFIRPSFPGQVGMSYLMASLVVEWIEEDRGFGALRAMLEGYRRGWSEERVFAEVLDATPDEVDGAFDRHLRETFRVRFDAVDAADGGGAFARALGEGARALAGGRRAQARARLVAAAEMFPEAGGTAGPHALLARLHREAGDSDAERAALEAWVAVDEDAYDALIRLAEVQASAGAPAEAARTLRRAIWIYPFEPQLHERTAALLEAAGDAHAAARERRAVLALDPPDEAGAWYRLAAALVAAGDRDGARDAVLRALEVAPRYEEALDLLLDLQG
ncbi:MAG TPA: tetratricopeptide repeat protein [Longimicrobiales bacterium]|nr:tetratricopeptide repeat protein [Longimicrobiales bacterium]